ncbi:TonB-dependent siderophore receptor [Sphingobium rhizovicinum]|uniref:TonB-dependent siderophore receptor n=1 Tax=Sphingobium rhizovicinum TaxID=432308 RepID=A0ABV7NMW0_9SPHN
MRFGRKDQILAAMLLAGAATVTIAPSSVMAQSAAAERQFDIGAQPLSTAITSFGQQSGLQVSAPADLLSGRASSSVNGRMSALSALGKLLSGTGLSFRLMGNTVVLERAPEVSEDAISLGPVRVEASGNGSGSGAIGGLRASSDPVVTEGTRSYAPLATNVGKAAQSLRQIPQSVTVITRQRLEDQNLISIEDVMLQTTGVTVDRNWLSSTYNSRGLPISFARYDGGATSFRVDGMSDIDTAIYDSIALVRGADGLFGAGEAGGVLNFSRKRALEDTQLQLNAFGGSWNNYRLEADATGPLTSDGRVRGRVIGVIDNGHGFQRFKQDRRALIHGLIEADLTPSTLLVAGFTRQEDQKDGFNVSLPRYRNGVDIGLPRDFNMGTPWNAIERGTSVFFGRLEQRIGDDWTVKLTANHMRNRDKTNAAEMENAVDPIDGSGVDWWYFQQDKATKETTVDLNTQGSFELFGQTHNLILGADYVRYQQVYQQLWTYIGEGDIFNPVYPEEPAFPPAWSYRNRQTIERMGLYGSLRIRPVESLSLIGGGRLAFRDKTSNYNLITNALRNQVKQDSVFIPYGAAIWDVYKGFSLYASIAEIYQSQAQYNSGPRPGTPLDPVTGRNYEAGVKGELADGRLTGSIAWYRVNKKGAAVSDPANPPIGGDNCCYIRDGYIKSQGFEVELNGEIFPGLQVAFGYTYNNNVNKRDSDARYSETTPKHLLKLWTDYKFQGDALKGLSLGVGVTAQSSNFRSGWVQELNPATGLYDGDYYEYQFRVKGYAIWSARTGYDFNDRFSISANLNNIFDKTYYVTIDGPGYGNLYGDPRNVMVTLRGKF